LLLEINQKKKKKKFQTVEIMTGGILPKGFDTIIPIEQIVFYPNKKNPKYFIDKKIKKISTCKI
jgi:molybdopterin molybdotransferase